VGLEQLSLGVYYAGRARGVYPSRSVAGLKACNHERRRRGRPEGVQPRTTATWQAWRPATTKAAAAQAWRPATTNDGGVAGLKACNYEQRRRGRPEGLQPRTTARGYV